MTPKTKVMAATEKVKGFTVLTPILYQSGHEIHFFSRSQLLVPKYFKVAANIKTLVIKSKLWRHDKRPSTIFICYRSKLYRQVKNF